ncbi:MFS transporter [Flavobacterium sp. '19STA2R22 D10 B1']|uniref:MFS transporter n=1 Tax=Flavobacterium aerium TaxID=3037261 RepID=UPI00278C31FE|nr:MFS transporter [Flavobacterium sp. '19STA2R22 D10 B1']
MMLDNSVFKPWIPDWFIKVVLMFCMLHSMVLLGVYTSNVTYSASFLDVEIEDLQFSLSVTYGTFLATILIESRLFKYFPVRNYFLGIYILAAFTFILSAYTDNYVLFIILRMIEGVLMALPWIPLRQLLLTRFKSKNATIIVFSFNCATLLLASPFIMTIAVWFLENYEWKYMAYASAFFQIICVGLVLLTFNGNRFYKKIPLYQIDWASFILVYAAILCGCYVFIYGEKKYWFESVQIVLASIIALTTSGLFIMRQLLVKRPCFDLTVFRYANLRTGFLLFLLFYVARATLNICHGTMYSVWGWEPMRVAHVQYINAFGNLIGLTLGGIALSKAVQMRYIFIIGFLLLAVYHFWFTFLFVEEVSLWDIAIPYLLQGIAVGMLFVPLILFTVSSVPVNLAAFSGTVGVTGRFWGSTIGFCIMQNAQIFLQQSHYSKLQQFVMPESPETQSRLTNAIQGFVNKGFTADEAHKLAVQGLINTVKKQSMLLSNMEIFTAMGWVLIALVLFLMVNKHLRQTFDIFKNKVWGS